MKNAQITQNESNDSNILEFASTLKELRKHVDPNRLRQREAWRDRNGNVRTVDYIEWHTVADILDDSAPNWEHTVKDIRVIGDFITVTVAISIDGVTREGIGTGSARSEMGIKKAEHDALKRAAVKFGIARDLYKKEFDAFELSESPDSDAKSIASETVKFPAEPVAKTLAELISTKQLGMIRAIARENNVDADVECEAVMKCKISELSRRAASALIDHLHGSASPAVPMRIAS